MTLDSAARSGVVTPVPVVPDDQSDGDGVDVLDGPVSPVV